MPVLTDPWFADVSPQRRWLLPVLPAFEHIPRSMDQRLAIAAVAAADGDREARDVLYAAFSARLEPVVTRLSRQPMIELSPLVDADEIRQEGYLAFVELIAAWNRRGSFTAYVTLRFPHRLARAVYRLARPIPATERVDVSTESQSWAAVEARAQLLHLAEMLPPARRGLLLARIGNERSLRDLARERQVSPRQIQRDWRALVISLRQLAADSPAERAGEYRTAATHGHAEGAIDGHAAKPDSRRPGGGL